MALRMQGLRLGKMLPLFIGIFLFYPVSWACLNLIFNES